MKKDPWEFNNIVENGAYLTVEHELSEELQEWRKKTNDPFFGIDKSDQTIQKSGEN